MLGKRLVAALMILMLLVGCGSNPTRDDGGSPTGQQTSTQDTGSNPNSDSGSTNTGGGGGFGNLNLNGDPRVLLGILVVVVVIVAAVAVYHVVSETIDSIRHHTHPAAKDATEDGIYHDPHGLFSVAIPGEYPAQGADGIEVRQTADQNPQQVFFITAKDDDPVYGVSVQPLASPGDATTPLADFATEIYPPPRSSDPAAQQKPLPPLLEEKLSLDGKPALFREYSAGPGADGKPPVYYLLYFLRDDKQSAVLSITWPKDCSKCSTGPETDIRGMDPRLKKFVDSFHMPAAAAP